MMMDLGNDDRFHQVGNLPENLDTVYNFDFQSHRGGCRDTKV